MADVKQSAASAEDATRTREDLSAVVGRIFDQLSLSAWMPGLALVAGAILILRLSTASEIDGRPEFGSVLQGLGDVSLAAALLALGAVVLATVIAQAFEFEMIKVLEGYWGRGWLQSRIRKSRVRRHVTHLKQMKKEFRRHEKSAFKSAAKRMSPKNPSLTDEVRQLWRQSKHPNDPPVTGDPSAEAEYLFRNWRRSAKPGKLRALEACEEALRWYPSEHRILPTRLGNTLRSAEDRMKLHDGGNLEGFVLRNYDRIPQPLLTQLSDFRTRLNMYCSLVLVGLLLAVASVPATWRFEAWLRATTVATFVVLALLTLMSYRAAIASARGYVSALLAADEAVGRQVSSMKASEPAAQRGDAGSP